MEILFVRHGETDWNAAGRIMGQQDVPLNATGRAQARAAAEALKGVPARALYASDLQRARATAEAINAHHGLPLRCEPALRERAFGVLEGLTPEEIRRTYPEHVAAYERDTLRYRAPGAESRLDFLLRVGPWFEALAARHPDQTVIVVAHGGVLRALVSHIVSRELALEPPRFVQAFAADNASISSFVWEQGAWQVRALNGTAHLERLAEPAARGAGR